MVWIRLSGGPPLMFTTIDIRNPQERAVDRSSLNPRFAFSIFIYSVCNFNFHHCFHYSYLSFYLHPWAFFSEVVILLWGQKVLYQPGPRLITLWLWPADYTATSQSWFVFFHHAAGFILSETWFSHILAKTQKQDLEDIWNSKSTSPCDDGGKEGGNWW